MAKKKSKKLKKFAGVRRAYVNWHGMHDKKTHNKQEVIAAYFMGFWTAFSDREAVEFLALCDRSDFEAMMAYPMWM